jgi:hypothetical protein
MTSTSDVSFRPEHRSLIAMRSGETPVFADARAEGASLFTPLLFLLTFLQIQGAHIWRLYRQIWDSQHIAHPYTLTASPARCYAKTIKSRRWGSPQTLDLTVGADDSYNPKETHCPKTPYVPLFMNNR